MPRLQTKPLLTKWLGCLECPIINIQNDESSLTFWPNSNHKKSLNCLHWAHQPSHQQSPFTYLKSMTVPTLLETWSLGANEMVCCRLVGLKAPRRVIEEQQVWPQHWSSVIITRTHSLFSCLSRHSLLNCPTGD